MKVNLLRKLERRPAMVKEAETLRKLSWRLSQVYKDSGFSGFTVYTDSGASLIFPSGGLPQLAQTATSLWVSRLRIGLTTDRGQ